MFQVPFNRKSKQKMTINKIDTFQLKGLSYFITAAKV